MSPQSPDSPLYGLALHTTTPDLGLALGAVAPGDPPRPDRVQVWPLGGEMAAQLHQRLGEFLPPQGWGDLAFVAVAVGPGGFTGTRLGVVTARTLAQQLQIPLFGVSTLAAIAHGAWRQGADPQQLGAIALPARRGQLFGAVYRWQGDDRPLGGVVADGLFTPEQWQACREALPSTPWLLTLPEQAPSSPAEAPASLGADVASVWCLAQVAWNQGDRPHWQEVLPFYGQSPVAESSTPHRVTSP